MKVPLGDRATLLQLVKESPDMTIARAGLLQGGNHPDDIDGMIALFRRFDHISYIKKSIKIWKDADGAISYLPPIAAKLHAEIMAASPSQKKLDAIIKELGPINRNLTMLENDFSYTLGEGARWLEHTILTLLLAIAITVELSGLLLTYFVVRGISKGLKEIVNTSKSISERNFPVKARVFSSDEIGQLATSFNDMTEQLFSNIEKRTQSDKELELKNSFIEENEKRIVRIMDALIKNTQLDFSEKLTVSDRGDELDAIAVGLNTLNEELEFHLAQSRESAEKLNRAQQLTQIGSWEWNIVADTIEWSDELYRIFGLNRENFKADYNTYLNAIHPHDTPYVNEIVQKAFHDFQPFDFNHRLILPNGEHRTLHGRGEVYVDQKGEIIKMVGTAQDITERRKAQEKIMEYTAELERKNREIEQFAYAASHDLQEPLRTISNFSKLLTEKLVRPPEDEIGKYLTFINGGAERMSKLIFALLEYSRIGKEMEQKSTDCNELVREIIGDLTSIIQETGAEITVAKLPVLTCYDLKSVFQNLILNAIKFRKKDLTPCVIISSVDTATDHLFTIADNGIGIEDAYYDRIFIIFQRLHTRFEYAGTGIGLSQCKKIIELNGGKIWVTSKMGEGSTFHFTIPKN